jgi:hypothetical protein
MTQGLDISKQITLFLEYLGALRGVDKADPKYTEIVKWVRDLPPASRPPELLRAISKTFNVSEAEILDEVTHIKPGKDFDALVPPDTWLSTYMDYTRNTEPPSVFHFFAGCVAIGGILARNVYFDKGAYQIYPNLAVLIIAPSGKCRKTSACNVGMSLLRKAGGNVLADKTTPEALVEAFREKANATGVIYAPEFAVFLGKQKYQEGMIPMLTALFDCPKEWRSTTITRGEVSLHNVAFSMLGCSTMDWIQTAIPRDAFGGGFMSRLLFVIQEDSPRVFPLPPKMDEDKQRALVARLKELTHMRGEYKMTPEATEWYTTWYIARKDVGADDKQFAGYNERKPDHLIRMAMILAASKSNEMILHKETLLRALHVLEWLEEFMPNAFGEMNQNAVGEEHARLLRQIKKRNGHIKHSDWLRLNSNRMKQREFRELVDTLRSAKLVDYDNSTHTYYLTPEGWK